MLYTSDEFFISAKDEYKTLSDIIIPLLPKIPKWQMLNSLLVGKDRKVICNGIKDNKGNVIGQTIKIIYNDGRGALITSFKNYLEAILIKDNGLVTKKYSISKENEDVIYIVSLFVDDDFLSIKKNVALGYSYVEGSVDHPLYAGEDPMEYMSKVLYKKNKKRIRN